MKKTLLITSLAAALGLSTAADAAFTPLGDGVYKMEITGGCFDFDNCLASGLGVFVDATNTAQATVGGFGSGIVGDGVMGVIDFSLTNGAMSVTSYSQDSYLDTAGGTFYLQDQDGGDGNSDGALMTGSVAVDVITFTPTGRDGVAAKFAGSLGLQEWNRDDSSDGNGSGIYTDFTTEASTNRIQGFQAGFTITGSRLVDSAVNEWTGTLVSAGNIGQAWGDFNNTQYSEQWNIKVSLVSADPIAMDDTVGGSPNTAISIDIVADLLNNDTHADATENINFISFTQPADAASSVVDNADGTLTYTPNPLLAAGQGVDSFTYTVDDDNGDLDTATVSINLAAGSPPIANADTVTTNEDTAVAFDPVAGVITGIVMDTDADADQTATLAVSTFDAVSANTGAVTAVGNTLTYSPAENFNGTDTINYTVIDSTGLSSPSASITVNVTAVNDAPVCTDISLTTAVDVSLDVDVATTLLSTTVPTLAPLCVDVEGDSVSLAAFDATGNNGGTMISDGAGTLTYAPATGFEGLETFSYTATDGINNAVTNTLKINVANASLGNFTMLKEGDGGTFGGTNDILFDWDGTFSTSVTDPVTPATAAATLRTQGNADEPNGHEFFGSVWIAHHIRMFGPGTYTFDTTCSVAQLESIGSETCNGAFTVIEGNTVQTQQFITITVGPDQVLAHILFDYNTTVNIDVFNLYNQNDTWDRLGGTGVVNKLYTGVLGVPPAEDTEWELVSTDGDGDGFVGVAMLDGAFIGYSANFSIGPKTAGTALPPIETEVEATSLSSLSVWGLIASLFSIISVRLFRSNK